MKAEPREYWIGVFGKPASQRVVLAEDYKTAYHTAREAFPDEHVFAVSADAVAIISTEEPPQQNTRRRYSRRDAARGLKK